MSILNTLLWWQWALLALIPPAIIALYFLKLKRQPLAVPSTYLWSRAIEDLHVNSLWQRLRQSLLLLLQLLLIFLLALTLLRPGSKGTELINKRHVFLIDTSASMSASDMVGGLTRLDEAKKQVKALIDQMTTNDQAMIITFSSRATPIQSYTSDRRLLRQKVELIEPTVHTSDLSEALRTASGLANPGQTGDASEGDTNAAEAMPATVYVLSDGGFPPVTNFSLGNLTPEYLKIGDDQTLSNVAIVAFGTDRNPDKPEKLEVFGRLENYGREPAKVEASLFVGGTLADVAQAEIPAREIKEGRDKDEAKIDIPSTPGSAGVRFELPLSEDLERNGVLRLEINAQDSLPADDRAYTIVSAPRPAKILYVTSGNDEAMQLALHTEECRRYGEVVTVEPKYLGDMDYQKKSADGFWDLVIYDKCAPQQMPACNTLFMGSKPPGDAWKAAEKQGPPFLTDIDQVHPLTQQMKMDNVKVAEGTPLAGPPGTTILLDYDVGPLYAVAPRAGYEDAVLGFPIIGINAEGNPFANTDWPKRRSFPVFALNAVKYLGGVKTSTDVPSVKPGTPAILRATTPVASLTVESPRQDRFEVPREAQNNYIFARTDELGVYDVREGTGTQVNQKFVVNLFDQRESDIWPEREVNIQHETIEAQVVRQSTRQEYWKWILLGAIGLLIFEWYVYNRRVYL
ncbi:MAG TPA: VWA domain-containing protein [Pirellulaceae bacterium]|nr:VWA domain-containing protein [Pirellulaceae bacterium]